MTNGENQRLGAYVETSAGGERVRALALCPNHSAMYRLVNGSRETMREAFQTLTDNELEVVLAAQDLTVYFSRTHIIDLNAVLDAEDSFPAGRQ